MCIYMEASLGIGHKTRNETTGWEKGFKEGRWQASWTQVTWELKGESFRQKGSSGRQGDRELTKTIYVGMDATGTHYLCAN